MAPKEFAVSGESDIYTPGQLRAAYKTLHSLYIFRQHRQSASVTFTASALGLRGPVDIGFKVRKPVKGTKVESGGDDHT
jgi:hypothetical protein